MTTEQLDVMYDLIGSSIGPLVQLWGSSLVLFIVLVTVFYIMGLIQLTISLMMGRFLISKTR